MRGGGRECLTQAVEGQPVNEARVSGQRERGEGVWSEREARVPGQRESEVAAV